MNNNEEQNVQKDVVEKKCKIRAWYFVVLLVGIGFIMFASYNIGYKLGNVAGQENNKKTEETNSNNTTNNTNTSNSNVNNTNTDSNNNSNVTSNNTTNNTNVLSDAEALKLGNEKWEYAFSASWCEKYNYDDKDQYEGGIALTNFDEVNSHFSSDNLVTMISTTKSFKEFHFSSIIEKDGKYYDQSGCGRGSLITYSYTDLKLVSKTNTEIKFTATSTYCDPMRVNRGEKCSTKESVEVHDFIIKMENGEWKIARFTLPN